MFSESERNLSIVTACLKQNHMLPTYSTIENVYILYEKEWIGHNKERIEQSKTENQQLVLCLAYNRSPKYLWYPAAPALLPITRIASLLDWLHAVYAAFFRRNPIVLALATSWSPHYNLGFTFLASCSGLPGLPRRPSYIDWLQCSLES